MFAAVNTVEPPIVEREQAHYREGGESWHAARLPLLEKGVRARLDDLSAWLGEGPWLDGAFGVGDLTMVTVLRRLDGAGILETYSNLCAYVARGEARPAYGRAFAAQAAAFAQGARGG